MRIFQCLSKRIMPNGNVYTGKHRLEYKPTPVTRDRLKYELEVEEQNMLLLRHPYLTIEQSRNHMAELRPQKQAERFDFYKKRKAERWWKPVRLEDKLNHLRHLESWDC